MAFQKRWWMDGVNIGKKRERESIGMIVRWVIGEDGEEGWKVMGIWIGGYMKDRIG